MLRRLFRSPTPSDPRRPAAVPDGTRVYAIGDIHGCADLLRRLHDRIRGDASPGQRNVAVYVGDYVDRGPDSREVIEILTTQPLDGFETVLLCGNHDAWMRMFLDDVSVGMPWLYNGGGQALMSYGVMASARTPLPTIQGQFAAVLPPAHRAFLDGLKLTHREGDYLFVHAGIRPGIALADQVEEDLLWIRDGFLDSDADHGMVVVHGHTIVEEPEVLPNRIGIDTGAFATGRLTCLVLEGTSRRFITA